MPSFAVETAQRRYNAIVERGVLSQLSQHIPASAGTIFVLSSEDIWKLHGAKVESALRGLRHHIFFYPGGEERKRMASVETLAEEMVAQGADRTSIVVAFGGGIVNDVGGFLAAIFMRGI